MALSYGRTWEDLAEDTENMIAYKFSCVISELIYACTRYYLHLIHIFDTVMNECSSRNETLSNFIKRKHPQKW
jgi:hypothetical protein